MSVRKEQVLLILVVLLAAYCSADKLAVDVMPVRYSPTALEYEPAAFREAALVATDADDIVRRDFFTEPSETRPLPPPLHPCPARARTMRIPFCTAETLARRRPRARRSKTTWAKGIAAASCVLGLKLRPL